MSLWESVHWRNEWDSTPSSFVAPVDGQLTPLDQGLEADSQIITTIGQKHHNNTKQTIANDL